MFKAIVAKRKLIQVMFSGLIVAAVFFFKINLLYILLAGLITGIIFGKVFCRWMCPMGFIMELMMANSDAKQEQLYNYHKLGCPIAWVSGWLNKFSLYKIKQDPQKCSACGICDKNCYITMFDNDYSHYKAGKKAPAVHFSCSKCLVCVAKCPTKSLQYKI